MEGEEDVPSIQKSCPGYTVHGLLRTLTDSLSLCLVVPSPFARHCIIRLV